MKAYVPAMAMVVAMAATANAQSPRRITLQDAIQIAVRQSSEVTLAENNVALDQIAVAEQKSRFLPSLSLSTSGGQSYGRAFSEAEGGLIGQTTNSVNLRLNSSVTLFDGFANLANLRSARLDADAGSLSAERTRQTVVFNVVGGFLTLLEAQEQVSVATENLAAQQKREAEVDQMVKAGSRPIAELYQQQSAVAGAKSVRVDAQRSLEVARLDLVQAMRLEPTATYDFVTPELEAGNATALNVDSMIARALSARVDLRAADARVGAAEQSVSVAKASRWPTLSLSAGYGSNYSSSSVLGLSNQLDQRQSGSLSIGVSVPVFDRGATSRAIQRAGITADNAQLELADLRRQVAMDVQRAALDRKSAQASLEAAQARLTAADQALKATELRYQAGVATLFEVRQTRTDFVDASSAAVRARTQVLLQDAVLDYYTGEINAQRALN
ncbi:MAG: TolC family protein [Gemmatimonadota bacterium]